MPAAIEQAQALLDRLNTQAATTRKTPEPDPVHDLRVAVRRFRQALKVYAGLFRSRDAKKLQRRVKAILSRAGNVRDCDITAKLLLKKSAGADALQQKLEQRRTAAVKELKASLRDWLSTPEGLPAKRKPPALTVESVAEEELRPAIKRFFSRGKDVADGKARGRELHEFRIEAKKFRYTLELLRPNDALLEDLREVQTALGDINDCRAANALLKELGADKEIRAAIKKRQRKRTAEFQRIWSELYALRKQWTRPPAKPQPTSRPIS